MTDLAKLNFRIARLRVRMRGIQSDVRMLTDAGLDCANACERLRRTQRELLEVIAQRDLPPITDSSGTIGLPAKQASG